MSDDAVENAWKIHAAIVDWTGKVDTKASFALTIEAALLAGVVTLSGTDRVFGNLTGWFPITLYVLGIVVLVAAVLWGKSPGVVGFRGLGMTVSGVSLPVLGWAIA